MLAHPDIYGSLLVFSDMCSPVRIQRSPWWVLNLKCERYKCFPYEVWKRNMGLWEWHSGAGWNSGLQCLMGSAEIHSSTCVPGRCPWVIPHCLSIRQPYPLSTPFTPPSLPHPCQLCGMLSKPPLVFRKGLQHGNLNQHLVMVLINQHRLKTLPYSRQTHLAGSESSLWTSELAVF